MGAPVRVFFTVHGDPVPCQRVRVTKRGTYTPKRTRDYERLVRYGAVSAGAKPVNGPVYVRARFFRANHRPCDVDNLLKSAWDALKGVCWQDDSQVVAVLATKAVDALWPRAELEIGEVSEAAWVHEMR